MANNAPVPLILTRPRAAADRFFASLPKELRAQFDPVFSPLIEIVPLDAEAPIGARDGAIFSSANGVAAAPPGAGRIAYCIGPTTTKAATQQGWTAIQSGKNADGLVAALTDLRPGAHLVHLSGINTRGDIAERLCAAGLSVSHVALYDQALCPMTQEAQHLIATAHEVVCPLFSARTATQFVACAHQLSSVHVVALSPAVAQVFSATTPRSLSIADTPDAQSMGVSLAEVVRRNRL
ncbi:MAG: uroporphyrinogen-III synthase [Pseudomonadota bacterium]